MTTDPFDSTEPIRPVEWTDWRESPAVQAHRDKDALRRILDELEGFLADAPADDPSVTSLRSDIARCRRFLSQGKPIRFSEGLRA